MDLDVPWPSNDVDLDVPWPSNDVDLDVPWPSNDVDLEVPWPSNDCRGQRNYFGELALAQLARHRAEDAGAHRILVRPDEHHRITVEADIGAVLAADFLHRPDHDGARDFTLLDGAVRHGFLHRHDDRVAERGVALVGAAHHTDALHLLGAGVVGYVKHGARLDHGLGRRAAEDLADPPALLLRERTRLLDQHAIAHFAFVALVVRLQLLGHADDALVARVPIYPLDLHHPCLLHGVAHHDAFLGLALTHGRLSFRRALALHGLGAREVAPGLADA